MKSLAILTLFLIASVTASAGPNIQTFDSSSSGSVVYRVTLSSSIYGYQGKLERINSENDFHETLFDGSVNLESTTSSSKNYSGSNGDLQLVIKSDGTGSASIGNTRRPGSPFVFRISSFGACEEALLRQIKGTPRLF